MIRLRQATSHSTAAPRPLRVLPTWLIAAGAVAVAAATILSLWWLLAEAGHGPTDRATLRIDAIKTALSVGAGTAGAIALFIAIRRQQLGERAQVHTEHDATERRVTDLYTKAADQLGSDKAPVRLAGLYALERLAQDNPSQRQTIVNVICAYLRMPFDIEDLELAIQGKGRSKDNSGDSTSAHQELQVRATAQDILGSHLRRSEVENRTSTFWPGMAIRLNGAVLVHFEAVGCEFSMADFSGVTFKGRTNFDKTKFERNAWFHQTNFEDNASFNDVEFSHRAMFARATFNGEVEFSNSTFTESVSFWGSSFKSDTWFDGAHFCDEVLFYSAIFSGLICFEDASFVKDCNFEGATIEDTESDHTLPPRWNIEPEPDGENVTFVRSNSTSL